jgi:hypothetical protein
MGPRPTAARLFAQLGAEAERLGIDVGEPRAREGNADPRAEYLTAYGPPAIRLRLRHVAGQNTLRPPSIVDAILLAHEIGHHLGVHAGDCPTEVREMFDAGEVNLAELAPTMSLELRGAFLVDEAYAWRHAYALLERLGFDDERAFVRVARVAFGTYVRGLEIGP